MNNYVYIYVKGKLPHSLIALPPTSGARSLPFLAGSVDASNSEGHFLAQAKRSVFAPEGEALVAVLSLVAEPGLEGPGSE